MMESILKRVLTQAGKSPAKRITNVRFVIGEMSGHTGEKVRNAWSILARDTVGEGASLHFREVKAEVQCMACFEKYHPQDGHILCPNCGSVGAKILTGEEFYMEALELE